MNYVYDIWNKLPFSLSALMAVLLSASILTGCATTGVNRGDINLVSLEEEWKLGSQLEADLARELNLINDATVVGYISEIGNQIVRQTELSQLPWKFHVVADPAINAFNIPGGHVYVNTGLIAAADNVAELAGVMAHEIAHGVSRHGTERITKAYGLNIGASLILGQQPAVYEQLLAQIVGTGAIAKFSRNDEREADRLGVRYMHAANYNPEGMASMFEKLLSKESGGSSSVARFFATHPLTSERIKDVRGYAQDLPDKPGLITRDNRLASVKQRISR